MPGERQSMRIAWQERALIPDGGRLADSRIHGPGALSGGSSGGSSAGSLGGAGRANRLTMPPIAAASAIGSRKTRSMRIAASPVGERHDEAEKSHSAKAISAAPHSRAPRRSRTRPATTSSRPSVAAGNPQLTGGYPCSIASAAASAAALDFPQRQSDADLGVCDDRGEALRRFHGRRVW